MSGLHDRGFPFVHLHVHSYYSFFASTLSPEAIVEWAAGEMGAAARERAPQEPIGDLLPSPRRTVLSPRKTTEGTGERLRAEAPRAIALTDTNSMTGIVEFYQAALAAGVKPILGVELTQPLPHEREIFRRRVTVGRIPTEEEAQEEEEGAWGGHGSHSPTLCHGDPERRIVALARNLEGYHELCELTSQRMLDPDFDVLRVAGGISSNVVVLSDWPEALAAMRGRARGTTFGLVTAEHGRRRRNRKVYEECRRLGLPWTVAGDVRLANHEDAQLLALLRAMRELTTMDQVEEREEGRTEGGILRTGEQIAEFFGVGRGHALDAELREAMANTVRIAEMCECRLPLREWKFPKFTGKGEGSGAERLRVLARKGLQWRYGATPPPEAKARLAHELDIIERLGFSDYFLLVHRIVEEARRRGFFTLGRGSAANSIVTYALGISHVCPLRHGLHFERFLNPERSSPPDIDLDFSWRERDEILKWCFEFFGAEKVALIATIQTLRLRQAVREVGKAYGLPPEELNGFNRLKSVGYVLEDMGGGEKNGAKLRALALEQPWRSILELAQRLTGWPRHLSIHCGGIVIAPEPVSRWVPLTHSAKGFVITQMDMVGVEELGLVKMDLLSNRSLGVLKDTLNAIELREASSGQSKGECAGNAGKRTEDGTNSEDKHEVPRGTKGERVAPEEQRAETKAADNTRRAAILAHEAARMKLAGTRRGTSVALAGLLEQFEGELPPEEDFPRELRGKSVREMLFDLETLTRDPATRALIHEGRTMGCFYIESPGMRALFERLRCKEFAEVVAASSIIRPGVAESGMMEEYIARHRGKTQNDIRFPRVQTLLQRLLPETYGVMVYQEDVLLVAHEVAGMTYGEADLLRRAMSGKTRSGEAMETARERFVRGAMECRELTLEEANEIWRQVASFAGYSFCKGHSAAFAVLSYQVAYLKAHYPAEFFAAVLDNGGGFYGAGAYLEEARRWGLKTLGPCVNDGDVHFRGYTKEAKHLRAEGWVRVGLGAVSRVSGETCERIVKERKAGGRYVSLWDFLRRVKPAPEEARQLARAGALDSVIARQPTRLSARQRCSLRQELLIELEMLLREHTHRRTEEQLFDLDIRHHVAQQRQLAERNGTELTEFEAHGRLCRWEMETLGFMVHGHPLDFVSIPRGTIAAREIRRYANRRVQMVGWAIAAKELAASNSGKPMKMLTLEDRTDTFEAVLFPQVYARLAPRTLSCGPYLVRGRVDMRLGSPTLEVETLEVLPMLIAQ